MNKFLRRFGSLIADFGNIHRGWCRYCGSEDYLAKVVDEWTAEEYWACGACIADKAMADAKRRAGARR